ncbi:hypothetical protein [Aquamicrobium sp.]|uniref:hypothetical protein n=1 Tax=Aquamicrobium sp. TaxID=1872579 RepID=UPI00259088BE|nr:hypothetical protein [Aquamicrobium sp.]MCK9549277.1 hypothetical protein [Aquamicrobium sp.]
MTVNNQVQITPPVSVAKPSKYKPILHELAELYDVDPVTIEYIFITAVMAFYKTKNVYFDKSKLMVNNNARTIKESHFRSITDMMQNRLDKNRKENLQENKINFILRNNNIVYCKIKEMDKKNIVLKVMANKKYESKLFNDIVIKKGNLNLHGFSIIPVEATSSILSKQSKTKAPKVIIVTTKTIKIHIELIFKKINITSVYEYAYDSYHKILSLAIEAVYFGNKQNIGFIIRYFANFGLKVELRSIQ